MAESLLILRAPSGISGDMLVSGLAGICGLDAAGLDEEIARIGVPELTGAVRVVPRSVNGIAGTGLEVALPHAHAHRHLADILAIIEASALAQPARERAARAFRLLAEAEAAAHGRTPEQARFHEVGALDSILDVCLACALFARLAPDRFICSPLPVCDGTVLCAHGVLATPAPAVLHLLRNVPVYGLDSRGETVTPTGVALLLALDAVFGGWPPCVMRRHVRVYGSRVLPDVPNGAVFALADGIALDAVAGDLVMTDGVREGGRSCDR